MKKKTIYHCPTCNATSEIFDEIKEHSWYCGDDDND